MPWVTCVKSGLLTGTDNPTWCCYDSHHHSMTCGGHKARAGIRQGQCANTHRHRELWYSQLSLLSPEKVWMGKQSPCPHCHICASDFGLISLYLALSPGSCSSVLSSSKLCCFSQAPLYQLRSQGASWIKAREQDTCLRIAILPRVGGYEPDLPCTKSWFFIVHSALSANPFTFYFLFYLLLFWKTWDYYCGFLQQHLPQRELAAKNKNTDLKASSCAGFPSLPCCSKHLPFCRAGEVVKRQQSLVPVVHVESLFCTHSYLNMPKPQQAASAPLALHSRLFWKWICKDINII